MKKSLFLVLILFHFSLSAQLKFNEIMTNNVSAYMDDSYNYSMWVELFNESTTTSYNQAACYITDDLKEPRKWNPKAKLVGPQQYSVLWFEQSQINGHSNFKLNPEGGKLFLLNAAAQILDSLTYPQQFRNASYGRKNNEADNWVFFEDYSPEQSNAGKKFADKACKVPILKLPGGFYTGLKNISFENPATGDTIYYTRNGEEPTRSSSRYTPGFVISISSTTVFRARTFSASKLPSEIITATYFIGERDFKLPVVSIVTDPKNLFDNTIGIYVEGTNGISGNGMNTPANWNQDWWRAANFELYDTTLTARLNQELDIQIAGGWTRMNKQKSLKINPRHKFGNNKLDYDIFAATKPNMKYRSILLRNSGNDFDHSMMRDGFMQSLVMKRMNLDYLAYEPAVCFMNGVYYGIQNLRERSNEDFIYSNYGLSEDEVILCETGEMNSNPDFKALTNFVSNNDITNSAVYNQVCEMMDMDNFMDYFLTEIYLRNTDWPHNNIKAWKKKDGGKWRWILYDTDFGYNIWSNDHTHNTLTWALGEQQGSNPASNPWSTILLRRLVLNDTFKKRFIDKFAIQISSTFEQNRANHILDSLASKISTEIVYHKNKFGSARAFNTDISMMKGFSSNRPNSMMNFIGARFLGNPGTALIQLSSNNAKAKYLYNSEIIQDANINLKHFKKQTYTIKAQDIAGYKFSHWLIEGAGTQETLLPLKSSWAYWDNNGIPAQNWYTKAYNDQSWKSAAAPLGYGGLGHTTTIGYGTNSNNKYPTAYFRKKVNISQLTNKDNFSITCSVDDGAVLYVNGTEIGRINMNAGTVNFNTYSTTYNNGVTETFNISKNLLNEGENLLAVEVHQCNATSSDLIFDLQMNYSLQSAGSSQTINQPEISGTLGNSISAKAFYEQTLFEDPDKDISIFINEVVASNSIIEDEYGENEDYIELYNAGNEAVNIGGWYISDTPYNPTFIQIPDNQPELTTIPSKGFLILWADDQPEQGTLHINFKLSKDGEKLVLSRLNYLNELTLVDSVSFPSLEKNISYSRVPDGSEHWMIQEMTFNKTNQITSGTPINIENKINVYPSLVKDFIRIENGAQQVAELYNLAGDKILSRVCESDYETIWASQLPKGVYILKVGALKTKIVKL